MCSPIRACVSVAVASPRRSHTRARTHARIRTHGQRTVYVEFDSGTLTHTRTRVNQRIGTLDSSTHITSQSARRHLKISFGRVFAAATRRQGEVYRCEFCLAKRITGFLLIYIRYRSISHPSCVLRINYAPPNDIPQRNAALDIPSE